MKRSLAVAAALLAQLGLVCLDPHTGRAFDSTVADGYSQPGLVKVEGVKFEAGNVRGTIVNTSMTEVADVQLVVRYQWLWKDERHPGQDNPGRSEYHVVREAIAPGDSVTFEHSPVPPLPLSRTDGRFQADVSVVGFTQVER